MPYIRLNSTHYFIIKISKNRELQQIAINHLSDIDFKDFMKLYKFAVNTYSFLVNDSTLALDNPLHFRSYLVKRIYNKKRELIKRLEI